MKRIQLLAVLSLACMGASAFQHLSAQETKVLLVTKGGTSADLEYVLTQEVGVMKTMLQDAGFQVVIASPSVEPLVGGTTTVTPDVELAEVKMADFAGIIMPCTALEAEPELPELEALIQEAVASGKPVAAQLGSVVHLARAGVMDGKRFAYVEEFLSEAPGLEGSVYGGQGVVEEGNILTGGVCPYAARMLEIEDTTPALTQAFISKIKEEGR